MLTFLVALCLGGELYLVFLSSLFDFAAASPYHPHSF